MGRETIQQEVDQNWEFFKENKHTIKEEYVNKFVLIRNKEFCDFYTTKEDALTAGDAQFKDGIFSVQKVSDEGIDLGSVKYALFQ